jgi:hypothetical protein
MIAYTTPEGSVAVCRKATSVPEGTPYIEVDSVPDRLYRNAWEIVGDAVVINAAKQAKIDARIARQSEATAHKGDAEIRQIIDANPAEIEAYINANVTNLAQARSFLIKLTKAVSAIGRESFTDE